MLKSEFDLGSCFGHACVVERCERKQTEVLSSFLIEFGDHTPLQLLPLSLLVPELRRRQLEKDFEGKRVCWRKMNDCGLEISFVGGFS